MRDKVKFSVIIPTYNRARLISKAIESVLCQTYDDFELIIVDDGSQDNTKEVIEKIKDDRLVYIYKSNGGQNSALNVGIRASRGEIISFLDSDDTWVSTKLERVLCKFNEDKEIKCVYHSAGKRTKEGVIALNSDYLEGYIYREVLMQEFMSTQISLSCKKECFDKIGLYDESFRCFQDDDICFLLAKNFKIGLIKEVLSIVGEEASVRVTDDSFVRAQDYNKLLIKYENDIIDLCGRDELGRKYLKLMTLYCRAKMWREAKKTQIYILNSWEIYRIKCKKIYAYELLKARLNITSAIWKMNKLYRRIKTNGGDCGKYHLPSL